MQAEKKMFSNDSKQMKGHFYLLNDRIIGSRRVILQSVHRLKRPLSLRCDAVVGLVVREEASTGLTGRHPSVNWPRMSFSDNSQVLRLLNFQAQLHQSMELNFF